MNSEAQRIILGELGKIREQKSTNSNINICCPFHSESHPSCGVYIIPNGKVPFGWFSCLGCGESGPWNKLAEKLNLQTVKQGDYKVDKASVSSEERKRRKNALLGNSILVEMPYGIPFNDKTWRTIKGETIRQVGGILSLDTFTQETSLFFPLTIRGKLYSVLKAQLHKVKGQQSYILLDSQSVKAHGIFPFDYVEAMLKTGKYTKFCLVEGPRDALRLIDRGIPALAILGTNMWSNTKKRLVLSLCTKYEVEPIVMMDGDPLKKGKRPGTEAQKKIYSELAVSLRVHQIKLWLYLKELGLEKLDPATLPGSMYRKIRALCR